MYRVDDGIFGNEREEKNSVNVSTFVVHSIYKVLFVEERWTEKYLIKLFINLIKAFFDHRQ